MKTYLGDAVYLEWDGYLLTLTTSDGSRDTNTIHMEPDVQVNLVKFIESIVAGKVKP
jgi:hypothetical protein